MSSIILEHQPRRGLFLLGVVGKVEARSSIGANVVRIGGMAGVAMRAQRGFPLVHDVVNLLAGQGLWQNFEIGRRGIFSGCGGAACAGCLGSARSLGNRGDGKAGSQSDDAAAEGRVGTVSFKQYVPRRFEIGFSSRDGNSMSLELRTRIQFSVRRRSRSRAGETQGQVDCVPDADSRQSPRTSWTWKPSSRTCNGEAGSGEIEPVVIWPRKAQRLAEAAWARGDQPRRRFRCQAAIRCHQIQLRPPGSSARRSTQPARPSVSQLMFMQK